MQALEQMQLPLNILQANQMIMTHHMRHIFTPIDQTNKKLFISCNNLLNVMIQSHSTK